MSWMFKGKEYTDEEELCDELIDNMSKSALLCFVGDFTYNDIRKDIIFSFKEDGYAPDEMLMEDD